MGERGKETGRRRRGGGDCMETAPTSASIGGRKLTPPCAHGCSPDTQGLSREAAKAAAAAAAVRARARARAPESLHHFPPPLPSPGYGCPGNEKDASASAPG